MKLTVVLPCYNEEENIARIPEILVPELLKLGCNYEIILVDDGSKDRSAEVAGSLNVPELRIMRHEKNKGIGAAIKTAIREATGDLIVTLDTDFTFHPKYIKDLIDRFKNGDVDFVIGSPRLARYGEDIQKYRVFISVAANMVYSALLGRRVTAVSPIFRLYRTSQLKELQIETDGFDISVEILFRLILAGRKFAEVPTPLGLRQFGVSKLNYKKEIFRHLHLIRKIVFWRLRSNISVLTRLAAVLLVAFIVGGIYILTNAIGWYQARALGRVYFPVTPVASNTIQYVLPRFREAYDGNLLVSDTDLYEHRRDPSIWPQLSPLLMLPIYKLFGGPLNAFWGDGILGAIFFLLVFFLIFNLTRRWFGSVFFSTLFLLSRQLPLLFSPARLDGSFTGQLDNLKVLVKTFLPVHIGSPYAQRVDFLLEESYKPGFLVMGSFLLLMFWIARLKDRKKKIMAAIFAGVCYGLLIYTYSFSWVFASVILGLLAAWALLRKEWSDAFFWFLTLLVGLGLSIGYWKNYLEVHSLPLAEEIIPRLTGFERGHAFLFSLWPWYLLYLALSFFIYRWSIQKQKRAEGRLLIVMLLAGIVLFNLQVVLGVTLTGDHWHNRVMVIPLMIAWAVLGVWAWEWLGERFRRARSVLKVLIVFIFISQITGASHLQIIQAQNQRVQHMLPFGVGESLLWMDKNIPRDSVVVTPSFFSNALITYYTSARIFVPRGEMSLISRHEMMDRLFITARILNLSPDELAVMFNDAFTEQPYQKMRENIDERLAYEAAVYDQVGMSYFFEGLFMGNNIGDALKNKRREREMLEERNRIIQEYIRVRQFNDEELIAELNKYRADYLYVGPRELALGAKNFSNYDFLEKIYEMNSVTLYRIRHDVLNLKK